MADPSLSPCNATHVGHTEHDSSDYSCDSSTVSSRHLSSIDHNYTEDVMYMDNPEEMLQPWIVNPMFFYIVITHSVTFFFGLVGNVIVVVVMVGDKKYRNATNLFLVSLAVADLLLLLVTAPLETLQYFVLQWDADGAVCKSAMFAMMLSAVVSVLNLVAVTLERFIVIVFPMKSRSLCTISNCRRAIVLVWLVSVILTSPVIFTKETFTIVYRNNVTNLTIHYCGETEQSGKFAIYQFVVLLAVPGTLMVVGYAYVIRELWRSTRNMQALTNSVSMKNSKLHNGVGEVSSDELHISNGSTTCRAMHVEGATRKYSKGEDARKARKQVIKMLILVVVLFLVCWGLPTIMQVIIKFNLHSFTPTAYRLLVSFNLLPFIHACMNPFIYSFMSKNFRRAFRRQLEKIGFRKRRRQGSGSRNDHGSLSRTSRMQRSTPTIQRLRIKPGNTSSSSSTTNCHTDITKHTDGEQSFLTLHPATSAV